MSNASTRLPLLDQTFDQAVQDGVFPGGVAFARNKNGSLNYAKAFGKRSVGDGPQQSMELNTVMAIASATKLLTTIAVLQIVERGLIGLDDELSGMVPLLEKQGVLHGLGGEGPAVLMERQSPLTLRQLLTHSAGTAYSRLNPDIAAWRKEHNLSPYSGGTYEEFMAHPLTYEPGTSWEYGTGIDWAGSVLERLTGQSLENHSRQFIFEPLGIQDITFWPGQHPGMESRLAKMAIRSVPSERVSDYNGPLITDGLKDCFGGHGGFADLSQYNEVLYSILVDDERLLRRDTTAEMFKPQLESEGSKRALNLDIGKPDTMFIGEFHQSNDYDWGLGGLLIGGDLAGWRRKNRLTWSGMPNVFWFIDREAGFCGVFGTQVIPPGDRQIMKVLTKFERAIYEENSSLQDQREKI